MSYQIENIEQLFENDYELLINFLEHHRDIQVPRIQELYDYAEGNNHEVLKNENRRNETDMADNRAVHNFGRKISTFRQGYLVGVPVQVAYIDGEEQSPTDLALDYLNRVNDFDDLNRTLVLDLSQVGRAYDIAYYTKDEKLEFNRLDPRETFVIYDKTIKKRQIAGVRYYQPNPFDEEVTLVEVYIDEARYYFIWDSNGIKENHEKEGGSIELNGFGDVQITEYLNNEQGIGDYETELPLIDLYDAAQSDTANYMTDLADAILVIYGNVDFPPDVDTAEKQIEYMKAMRHARLMQLIPPQDEQGKERQVNAEYLYKQYDVNGTEAYKTRLHNDIHEFTSTPDLSDENFGNNQSGQAMKYKLFGLDQERVSTQALFEKGLRRRYKLLANIYPEVSTSGDEFAGAFNDFDPLNLRITFTPNLPQATNEIIETASKLWNMVSDESVFEVLQSATNVTPENEKKRLEQEEQEAKDKFDPPAPRRTEVVENDEET
jgi:SPP1 family phage portal protein